MDTGNGGASFKRRAEIDLTSTFKLTQYRELDKPVVDQTGLQRRFDLSFLPGSFL
jgi:hypothetical protein